MPRNLSNWESRSMTKISISKWEQAKGSIMELHLLGRGQCRLWSLKIRPWKLHWKKHSIKTKSKKGRPNFFNTKHWVRGCRSLASQICPSNRNIKRNQGRVGNRSHCIWGFRSHIRPTDSVTSATLLKRLIRITIPSVKDQSRPCCLWKSTIKIRAVDQSANFLPNTSIEINTRLTIKTLRLT